jgi:hypothetical protein
MNSQRDNVKDAIEEFLRKKVMIRACLSDDEIAELRCILADEVFIALGITYDEQTSTGGYFMHHAGKKDYAEYILVPLTDEIKEACSWEEAGHYIWKFITEAKKI